MEQRRLINNIFLKTALVFLPVICSFRHPESARQETHYSVIKSGKSIGHFVSSKTTNSDVTEYTSELNLRVSLLVDVTIYNKVQGSFVNGVLQKASLLRKINGKEKIDGRVSWDKDKYVVTTNGNMNIFRPKINYSTVCLMYMEPEQLTEIYSESFGRFVPIEKISDHKYALKLPDGNNNYYTYTNGVCVEVEIPTTFATVFIRKD